MGYSVFMSKGVFTLTQHATSYCDIFPPVEILYTVHTPATATSDERHRNLRRDTMAHCSKKSLSREGGKGCTAINVEMAITFLIIDGF